MFKNYLKIAWRNLVKNKVYSLLNVSGLAIGMAIALIIGLWVMKELSYNKFLPKYEQLYQVRVNYTTEQRGTRTQNALSQPLLGVLRKEIPEVKNVVPCDWITDHSLMVGDRKVLLQGACIGSEFLTMFEYPMLQGNPATSLKETYSIVLTESTAKALFGNEDPMNKQVRIDNLNNLTVTGILKDIPENSSLQFKYLLPFAYYRETTEWVKRAATLWNNNSFRLFVELQPGIRLEQVAPKIKNLICINFPKSCDSKPEVFLQPMKEWNLYDDFENGKCVGGFIDYVRMFSIIGLLVLFIACINFMNLSTARSSKRAKEVGIRKAIGSYRKQLIIQFLTESVLIAFLSSILSLLIVHFSLPYFNELTWSSIRIPYQNGVFWVIMLGYVLFTGLLAGSRPAFYLSSFHPARVLKGTILSGKGNALSRKLLVVLQFSCSIAFIIGTLIVYQQVQYAQNRSNGYDVNRLMTTSLSSDLEKNYEALKNDLLKSGLVENVAIASTSMVNVGNNVMVDDWPGKKDNNLFITGLVWISPDYFKTVGMKIKEGRDLSSFSTADSIHIVVNEALVKGLGLKAPVGQVIKINRNETGVIVGVVGNALMRSPYNEVEPVVFRLKRSIYDNICFLFYRLKEHIAPKKAIAGLASIFSTYNPSSPYIYTFADEDYKEKFQMEILVGNLVGIFAVLAVFISCLGLFGLAAFTAEQRKKEIGVRKVLGASVTQLWLLLCKDFILLVFISCIIASPLAFYFLDRWLEKYNYHIQINAFVFIAAAVLALLVTFLTISFQAIKAAVSNPVKNLRTE